MNRRRFIYLMFIASLMIPFGILKMIMRVVAPRFDFDKVAFPMIKQVFPDFCIKDLISVQPMMGPVGKVFYMDYKYKK